MGKAKVQSLPTFNENAQSHWKRSAPLEPMNQVQSEYIHAINTSPYVIATGLPGTSKTYIPARIAALWLQQGAIKKIYLVRPAVSMSSSLGFFKGDAVDKMKMWLAPIMSALREEFPYSTLEYFLKDEIGKIEAIPMETIKGRNLKDCFVIIDEAEDLKFKEVKMLLTRLGTNATMVFAGDTDQVDINQSGISTFLDMQNTSPTLRRLVTHIHFGEYGDIVRSQAMRNLIRAMDNC